MGVHALKLFGLAMFGAMGEPNASSMLAQYKITIVTVRGYPGITYCCVFLFLRIYTVSLLQLISKLNLSNRITLPNTEHFHTLWTECWRCPITHYLCKDFLMRYN